MSGAHIGEEADRALGHGKGRRLRRDPVAAVHAEACAAAHDDAVDQGDVRF